DDVGPDVQRPAECAGRAAVVGLELLLQPPAGQLVLRVDGDGARPDVVAVGVTGRADVDGAAVHGHLPAEAGPGGEGRVRQALLQLPRCVDELVHERRPYATVRAWRPDGDHLARDVDRPPEGNGGAAASGRHELLPLDPVLAHELVDVDELVTAYDREALGDRGGGTELIAVHRPEDRRLRPERPPSRDGQLQRALGALRVRGGERDDGLARFLGREDERPERAVAGDLDLVVRQHRLVRGGRLEHHGGGVLVGDRQVDLGEGADLGRDLRGPVDGGGRVAVAGPAGSQEGQGEDDQEPAVTEGWWERRMHGGHPPRARTRRPGS